MYMGQGCSATFILYRIRANRLCFRNRTSRLWIRRAEEAMVAPAAALCASEALPPPGGGETCGTKNIWCGCGRKPVRRLVTIVWKTTYTKK